MFNARYLGLVAVIAFPALSHAAQDIRKIYHYSCQQTFLVGSGITESTITCNNGMELGLYTGSTNEYLYSDSTENNFAAKGKATDFYSPICGNKLAQFTCGDLDQNPSFGLSKDKTKNFSIALGLPAGPNSPNGIVGYAAAPNTKGKCAKGLAAMHIFTAYLPSFNSQTSLKNVANVSVLAPSGTTIPPYVINYVAPSGVCKDENCPQPTGEAKPFMSVPFVEDKSSALCVIPAKALAPYKLLSSGKLGTTPDIENNPSLIESASKAKALPSSPTAGAGDATGNASATAK